MLYAVARYTAYFCPEDILRVTSSNDIDIVVDSIQIRTCIDMCKWFQAIRHITRTSYAYLYT